MICSFGRGQDGLRVFDLTESIFTRILICKLMSDKEVARFSQSSSILERC